METWYWTFDKLPKHNNVCNLYSIETGDLIKGVIFKDSGNGVAWLDIFYGSCGRIFIPNKENCPTHWQLAAENIEECIQAFRDTGNTILKNVASYIEERNNYFEKSIEFEKILAK